MSRTVAVMPEKTIDVRSWHGFPCSIELHMRDTEFLNLLKSYPGYETTNASSFKTLDGTLESGARLRSLLIM